MDEWLEGLERVEAESEGDRRLSSEEGPRERLARMGAPALTDPELLAVLLGSGTRGRPVLTLADSLIRAAGSLRTLVLQDAHELAALPGLGPARAAAVLAALELGRRVQRSRDTRPRLLNSKEVYAYLAPSLSALRREVFHVLSFNARNTLLSDVRIATGTVSSCPVDPREVFAAAIAARASGIVLAHNHPSGDPTPSTEDLALTDQLRSASHFLGIKLLDHVVLGDGCFATIGENSVSLPMAAEPAVDWVPALNTPSRRAG